MQTNRSKRTLQDERALTIEITSVFFIVENRDELCFLPQQGFPVDVLEETMFFYFKRAHRTQPIVRFTNEEGFDQIDSWGGEGVVTIWPLDVT